MPDSTFHWQPAEGIEHIDSFCSTCHYRLKTHGSADPRLSWSRFDKAVSRANSIQSEDSNSEAGSVGTRKSDQSPKSS